MRGYEFSKGVGKSQIDEMRVKVLLRKIPTKYYPMIEGFLQGIIDGQYSDIVNEARNG